jgi:surface antigen
MRFYGSIGKKLFIAAAFALGLVYSAPPADASSPQSKKSLNTSIAQSGKANSKVTGKVGGQIYGKYARASFPGRVVRGHGSRAYAYRGPTLQCVAFARSASNISLSGNAADWWGNAAGTYGRGQRPQAGSVLAFTANGRMRLGHVAVVSRVINGREIEIDHANWSGPGSYRGGVARGVAVVDVSERNDWTAVRVGLGRSGDFGSVYPTYGFIYDQADTGIRVASVATPALSLVLNPPPHDLRSIVYGQLPALGQSVAFEEVAEVPAYSGSPRNPRERRHH